jgi:haloalkane dehalogenase
MQADSYPFTSRFVEIEGVKMHYVDEGEGEVILMLHGNPTWSYLYRHIIKALATKFRCVAPDLIGFGLSEKPSDADYCMRAHIRRLAAFIEALELRQLTLVMQDWGGIIGLGHAVEDKGNVKRLVILNTAGFLPRGRKALAVMLTSGLPVLSLLKVPLLGELAVLHFNLFVRWGIPLGVHNRKRLTKEVMEGYLLPFPDYASRRAVLRSPRQIPMTPLSPTWHLLRTIERGLDGWHVPAQIIWGMKDPIFTPWFIRRFEELLPNHRPTIRIQNASHFLQEDNPEPIIRGIGRFMQEPT